MVESAIVKDVQKLDPASGLVELFEIEVTEGTFIYVHAGLEADLTTVQFRDYTTTSTIRTYTAIPMQIDGFEHKSSGAISRPKLSIANATNAFSGAVGSVDYDTMVGLKVIRRLTLNKYLYGNAGDAQPPVEFPRELWYIDSIKSRDKTQVTFELTSPFDLQGLRVPTRQIVANRCPWIYQAASPHLDHHAKVGGCTWNIESTYAPSHGGQAENVGDVSHTAYYNIDDQQVVPSTTSFTTYSSGAVTKDAFYKTSGTSTKIDADGSLTAGSTVTNYWQATVTENSPGTPTDINSNFKRILVYTTYNHGTEYFAYTSDTYNDYVKFTDNVASSSTYNKTLLWKVRTSSVSEAPGHGEYWERGDLCSKTMDGCKARFGYSPLANTANQLGKAAPDTGAVLPFGGFPAAKAFK